jgi:hypothetical protein
LVIENEKNHTFDFNIVFWLYAINQKLSNFYMIIWFDLIFKKLASILLVFGKTLLFSDKK